MANFADRLAQAVRQRANPVLVGLDPRLDQLPPGVLAPGRQQDPKVQAAAYSLFCRSIIDVVAPLVPAVKPQSAFFEQLGPSGAAALAEVVQYARQAGLLVILDAKRNDIGSTAAAYAEAYLAPPSSDRFWAADALTVSPYLGDDSLAPFVEAAGRHGTGIFVLVKTSNPGGRTFQDLVAAGRPIYRHVAELVEHLAQESVGACGYGAIGAVVGATYPEQLAELRSAMPHTWILVPGYGSQGGTAADVAAALDGNGLGALINNSRSIIFAHASRQYAHFGAGQWQRAVEAATREMIDQLRSHTPAARLAHN